MSDALLDQPAVALPFDQCLFHQLHQPLGQLLHRLRVEKAPLGLLYGAHCPPEIRVRNGAEDEGNSLPAIHEVTTAVGQVSRTANATTDR